jgi:hypothetical protein
MLNPEIEKLVLSNSRIKPLVMGWSIKKPDPFYESYIWEPKLIYPIFWKKKIAVITAKSYWGFYGLFKPSVSEVMQSIPENILGSVDFFQITGSPKIVEDYPEFEVTLYKSWFSRRTSESKSSLMGNVEQ